MNHTPGPWTLRQSGEANHHTIDNPNSKWLVVIKQNGELSSVIQESNARLIASAPELLEVLEELIAITPFRGSSVYHTDIVAIQAKARQIITKAKGDLK